MSISNTMCLIKQTRKFSKVRKVQDAIGIKNYSICVNTIYHVTKLTNFND